MNNPYFEGHAIFRPDSISQVSWARQIGLENGFWMAMLDVDHSKEEKAGDIIFTTRSLLQSDMLARLRDLSTKMPLVRVKIERVVFDTKDGDKL